MREKVAVGELEERRRSVWEVWLVYELSFVLSVRVMVYGVFGVFGVLVRRICGVVRKTG